MLAPPPPTDFPQRLLGLLGQTPCVLAVFDENDELRWCNDAFRAMCFLAPHDMPSWMSMMRSNHARGVGTRIQTTDFERWLASAASRRGKQPFRSFEIDQLDGRWTLMTETMSREGWMLCIGVEVTDLGRDSRHLRAARDLALRASLMDALTGLGNRAFVMQCLADALAQPDPAGVCVALLDLDHFKRINDCHGHAAGDQVLCDFAKRLQGGLRRADASGRIGGEEFLVVLCGVGLDKASPLLERLLASVRSARPLPERAGLRYTCSAGLACALPGETPEALMARADKALYAAKHGGRDRCAVAA